MTVKVRLKDNQDLRGEVMKKGQGLNRHFLQIWWLNALLGPNPTWTRLDNIVFIVPAGRRVIE